MSRQSFATWKLPRALDGVVLLEDWGAMGQRVRPQERHSHDELELHFIERGQGLFLCADRRFEAPAGALLWIPPRRDHLLLECTEGFRRWLLLFRRRVVRRVLPPEAQPLLLGTKSVERFGVLAPDVAVVLRRLYADVSSERGLSLPLVNAGVGYALSRSYLLFQTARSDDRGAAFHVAVVRALQMLRDAASLPSLAELASHCNMSESHFSKLFARQVGVSVTDFRNRLRLERFLELYGDGTRSLAIDAALEAGFGSYPQFHRVFRRFMGHSPGEHRKRSAPELTSRRRGARRA